MHATNPDVDHYFGSGCGRCPLGNTPLCKVHKWQLELQTLRTLLLDCGLQEMLKWGVACYTFQEKNVILLSAFNDFCALSFFKGALLQDAHGILDKPGEHTQAARLVRFTDTRAIAEMAPTLQAYVFEAMEIEKAGLKVTFVQRPEPAPAELLQKFDDDPVFQAAFEALTPGRQRGYILYFSAPKQARTRVTRIEKYSAQILRGKGIHD